MKKFTFLLFVCLLSVTRLNAQVVTPSLNSAFPVEMASAVAWRFGSAVGATMSTAKEENSASSTDYYYANTSVLFAYQPGTVVTEIYWAPVKKTNIWDASTDTFTESASIDGRFKLAIRGQNRVSVGIGYNVDGGEISSTTIKSTSYEGSFSIRMLDVLYVAGGMQRVSEKYSTGDALKWNQILGGVALQVGDPFGTMFKSEASILLSPEATEDGSEISGHPKTTDMTFSAELLFSSFLFSYRYKYITYGAIQSSDEDRLLVNNQYGVGFKFGGFLLGIYGIGGIERVGDKRLDRFEYLATISFGFI